MATVTVTVQREPGFATEQKAPSQASRTSFTPGKASSQKNDQNWPVDFHTYVGIPNVDAHMNADKWRQTVVNDIHARNSSLPSIPVPTNDPYFPTNPVVVSIRLNKTTDTPAIMTNYTQTETVTDSNNGKKEKQVGNLGFIP